MNKVNIKFRDVADVGRISDLNVGFHGYWFSLFR